MGFLEKPKGPSCILASFLPLECICISETTSAVRRVQTKAPIHSCSPGLINKPACLISKNIFVHFMGFVSYFSRPMKWSSMFMSISQAKLFLRMAEKLWKIARIPDVRSFPVSWLARLISNFYKRLTHLLWPVITDWPRGNSLSFHSSANINKSL